MIADVGQDRYEEVNYVSLAGATGANFGWDAWEGFAPRMTAASHCPIGITPDPGGTTMPIHA